MKTGSVFRSHRKRNIAAGVALGVVILGAFFLVRLPTMPTPGTYSGPASAGTMAQFNYLSQQQTDACQHLGDKTANVNFINSLADSTYLQGSCCTPMASADYSRQTAGLKNYSSITIVTPDPYNVAASQAKAMVKNVDLALTPAQQAVYDNAMSMTDDKGPCCCMCWAGYAHEGQAKTLIVENGYDAQQLAAVLNLEDCCGGPGQMNM